MKFLLISLTLFVSTFRHIDAHVVTSPSPPSPCSTPETQLEPTSSVEPTPTPPSFPPFPQYSPSPSPVIPIEPCPTVLPLPKNRRSTSRIVGGSPANSATRSHMAALTIRGRIFCSATLLSSRWALTASHCLPPNPSISRFFNFTLRLGARDVFTNVSTAGDIEIQVLDSFSAPRNPSRPDLIEGADANLLYLASEIPPGFTFARVNTNASLPADLAFARAAAYGQRSFKMFESVGALFEVDVPTVSRKECEETYPYRNGTILCTGYKERECGLCYGDSGGALLQYDPDGQPVIIGIPSTTVGCGSLGFYDGSARVSDFVGWMKDIGAEFEESTSAVQVSGNLGGGDANPKKNLGPKCPAVLNTTEGKTRKMKQKNGGKMSGINVAPEDARFMVSLRAPLDLQCSGVLLSRLWVLTSAECPVDYSWRLYVGGRHVHSGLSSLIERIFRGTGERIPDSSPFSLNGFVPNVTLIRLRNDTVHTGASVLVNARAGVPKTGAFGRFFGYGLENVSVPFNSSTAQASLLTQLEIPVAAQGTCTKNKTAHGVVLCGGFASEACDACKIGNRGGPLMQYDRKGRPVVVGVLLQNGTCIGRGGRTGAYADIKAFLKWMKGVGAEFEISKSAEQVFSEVTLPPETEYESGLPLESEEVVGQSSDVKGPVRFNAGLAEEVGEDVFGEVQSSGR